MKKIMSIFLISVLLCSLCSCSLRSMNSKKTDYNKLEQKYGYQSPIGVSYGMSVSEVKKTLRLKDKNFIADSSSEIGSWYSKEYKHDNVLFEVYKSDLLYKEYNTTAYFVFMSSTKTDIISKPILAEIFFLFKEDVVDKDIFQKIDDELTRGKYSYDFSALLNVPKYSNSNRLSQIEDKDLLAQYKIALNEMMGNRYISTEEKLSFDKVSFLSESIDPLQKVNYIGVRYTGIPAAIIAHLTV